MSVHMSADSHANEHMDILYGYLCMWQQDNY